MSKDKPEQPRQWHPLFAQVLRPLVEEHYDVETNFPVGDAPREDPGLARARPGDHGEGRGGGGNGLRLRLAEALEDVRAHRSRRY